MHDLDMWESPVSGQGTLVNRSEKIRFHMNFKEGEEEGKERERKLNLY